MNPYQKIFESARKAKVLDSIKGLLHWDQETYMPLRGIDLRAEETALMAHLVHREMTSKKFGRALSQLVDLETGECFDDSLSFEKRAALREWRRDYLHEVRLPPSFVKLFAKTTALAQQVWQRAKEKSDFKLFAPHLEKIVSLCRQKADYLSFNEHPYDALLDLYEPEMTTHQITSLFGSLHIHLTALLKKISGCGQPPSEFLHQEYEPKRQLEVGKMLLKAMGLESDSSRIDLSAHPFCLSLSPHDLRLTTRIHPENLSSNLFSVLHEGGHALYEKNLPAEHFGSPLCEGVSLGVHESQSRFWEVFIGHSHPFWEHCFPLLQREFPETLSAVSLDDFFKAINTVAPSCIRIEADEVTYCQHILLRFEMEKALLEGNLKVRDIPEVWNEKMRAYLGISPSTDDRGCLQDIHWSLGALGYFPTYALGNLYAAQLFQAFETAFPHWKEEVKRGALGFISSWLQDKVHKWGRQYPPARLIQQASGQPLSTEPFLSYLKKKYSSLYHLHRS
ncbi:MAG: carboxypeptidase [Chlamydiae bacterium GWC2_50_10]|nr:MAG: carboxypeptidase [Chlamydiae bacterium GWC2_50_10]